jgi:hypothetical protein
MRAALVLSFALGACDSGDDTPAPARCPTWGEPTALGFVSEAEVTEASGLAASRRHADTVWVHNDSGDSARLFALGTDGQPRGALLLDGASARDWEDLATGPGPDNEPALFVGDIGDNASVRTDITVWRVPEPAALSGTASRPTRVTATALQLTYPDGAHDAEALMIEPDGSIVVVTKSMDGASGVYRAAAPVESTARLEAVAQLDIGSPPMDGDRMVTAGDIAADGSAILLRTYLRTWIWPRATGESLADALALSPCLAPTPPEPQGEAVGFTADGTSYLSISEGEGQPVWRVTAE